MPKIRGLGQFEPVDRIGHALDSPSGGKRPGRLASTPFRSPKRRKRELSPLTLARDPLDRHSHMESLPHSPATGRALSFSNQSVASVTLSESSDRHKRRRRRRRHKGSMGDGESVNSSVQSFAGEDVPDDKKENKDDGKDMEDDSDTPVEVPPKPSASRTTPFSIELHDPPKVRFRDRMLDNSHPPRVHDSFFSRPTPPSSLFPKRPALSNGYAHDSVDELSTEYYHAQPAKRLPKKHTSIIDLSRDNTMPLSSHVQNMIDRPLRVQAAFWFPGYSFAAAPAAPAGEDSEAAPSPAYAMTVDPKSPHVLRPVDTARTEKEKLFWLKADLKRTNQIKYDKSSPIVILDVPQQGHQEGKLGAIMGFRFQSSSEAQRLVAWASTPECGKGVHATVLPSEKLRRIFDSSFSKAKAAGERLVGGSADALVETVEADGKAASVPERSPLMPPLLEKSTPSSSPPQQSAKKPRSIWDTIPRMTRQRASLSSLPAETVDVDSPTITDAFLERRRSTRATTRTTRFSDADAFDLPPVARWTVENPDWAQDWRIPLTYSRTTVDKDDVARLDEGEFLNDNVINFYLQYLQDEVNKGGSSVANRVYFHNTFFYEKLRPQRGRTIDFDGVRRWTAKMNLFSYDYIVVPVNEYSHWWVAIIANVSKFVEEALPGAGPQEDARVDVGVAASSPSVVQPVPGAEASPAVASPVARVEEKPTESTTATTATPVGESILLHDDSVMDDDDDNDVEVTLVNSDIKPSSPAGGGAAFFRKRPARAQAKRLFMRKGKDRSPRDPCILTLDSLGSPHGVAIAHLKQWMLAEMEDRKGVKPVDPGPLGMTAKKIPQQENFCDCGVYLLSYVQEFIKDPDGFIEDVVMQNERPWSTSAPVMRTQLRDLILHMQKNYQAAEEEKQSLKKQHKHGSAGAGVVGGAAAAAGAGATLSQAEDSEVAEVQPGERSSSPCVPVAPPVSQGSARISEGEPAGGPAGGPAGEGERERETKPAEDGTLKEPPQETPAVEKADGVDRRSSAASSVELAEPWHSSPFKDRSPDVFAHRPQE